MGIIRIVKSSLGLLTSRDRVSLRISIAFQMSTAILDLIGVVLIGAVSALTVASVLKQPIPPAVAGGLSFAHLESENPIQASIQLGAIALVALISKSALNIFLSWRVTRFLAVRQASVSDQLIAGLLRLPYLEVRRRSSQETAYALTNGVYYAILVILAQWVLLLTEASLLLILGIALVLISPVVALFSIVFFVIVALFQQKLLSGWVGKLGERAKAAEILSVSQIHEAIYTYRETLVLNRRNYYVKSLRDSRTEAADVQSQILFMGLIPKYVFEAALIIGAALLAVSQFMTRDTAAAFATLSVFLVAGSRILPSLLRMQGAALTIRSAQGQAEPTFQLNKIISDSDMCENTDLITFASQVLQTAFQSTISVKNVSFSYQKEGGFNLSDINFEALEGQAVAIVGDTGSGKSTLADLVLGVVNPDSGAVQISGRSPREAIALWPGMLAYVPQQVSMINGTIRENVALGIPPEEIDDSQVWNLIDQVRLGDFLRNERGGIHTLVGESGIKLSGGQRQRIGLARALYSDPKLIILDEATSALDAETEESITSTMNGLHGKVTTLTIAHRLSTIKNSDLIVLMDGGRVAAMGSFEEVKRLSPKFEYQAKLLGL